MFGPYLKAPLMICHHGPNDSSCSSNRNYSPPYEAPKTPDADKYEILDATCINKNLVMKVRYPNCSSCAYEGTKILVFLGVTALDALKWKRIDPHFRDPKPKSTRPEAPSPAARFPASDEGWQDALNYAQSKT